MPQNENDKQNKIIKIIKDTIAVEKPPQNETIIQIVISEGVTRIEIPTKNKC